MQTNSHFQTRSERLLILHIKEYINRPRHYERGLLEQVVFLHDHCSVRSDIWSFAWSIAEAMNNEKEKTVKQGKDQEENCWISRSAYNALRTSFWYKISHKLGLISSVAWFLSAYVRA